MISSLIVCNTWTGYISAAGGEKTKKLLFLRTSRNVMTKFLPISFCVLFSIQESLGQCQYSFGSPIHTKQASYFCHQYVKAALIGNFIDMADGKPKPNVNES